MVATYVNGDILLQSKIADNQLLVVKRVKDTSLPKIVKVQGGIKMAEDGTIMKATDTISTKTTSASSISTSDRRLIKNDISEQSEAGGITTVPNSNTVNSSGDATVPSGSSSHIERKGTSNSPCLSDGSKLEHMQVNGAVGTFIRKIIKLGNVSPSITSGNSGVVSTTTQRTYTSQMAKTDSLSTTNLSIADESTKTETAVTETSTVSALANRTVVPVQPCIGPIKSLQNIVKVKDFGFIKTSTAQSKMANSSNACSLRNIVKLTRLDDGTLVMKLPSPSKPESQSVEGVPMKRCAAPHTNAAKTEISEGNKLNAPAGVVRVLESKIVDTSAFQQKLATKKQILPGKPFHTVVIRPTEPNVSNADAAKSTVVEVTKSKAPIGVMRVLKTGPINTSSFISPSKTIVSSSIERSVPNSSASQPTVTGVNQTKAPNEFVRIVKPGIYNTSASPSKTDLAKPSAKEVSNAKIPAAFVRVANGGILHTSVSPAISTATVLTAPNPPETIIGTNHIAASTSKSATVTSMKRSAPISNAAKPTSTGPRPSSAAVNQVQSTTIDKPNGNTHKQSATSNSITTNMRVPATTASTSGATMVTSSKQVVPETAPPSSSPSSLFPVWDKYRFDLSSTKDISLMTPFIDRCWSWCHVNQ
ncbi:hypothetical protein ZHAS_00002592 [Anopheles sinensis]|uniref:Uncharacterized protein n=1 Tax=Anopheles sinensis TaxID=74873 RepID=A0A084VCK1_ANOSI|nr:hypothetical protein ZHAS_00002592 [Anopheles sinensis]